MQYRREIDGLRCVAVLPVIGFHGGLKFLSGGFVGVDIFFVISGYLITGIIISELEAGKFSVARFYERRARRILPALSIVILSCIPFAWLWMLPSQMEDFAKSIVAVALFVSNFLFWAEQGYFAPAAVTKPLLHTWSLAVEEQYYLLFPLMLMVLWRFGRAKVVWVIATVAILSFGVCEWGWRHAPTANFYLAPSRAWELFVGSICAFAANGKPQRRSNILSLLGLALILFSIVYYDEFTPFPSVYALAPVIGTALIILYGSADTWTGRILGLPPIVGIGLISYSAYLWHQPLFAFARLRSLTGPPQWLMICLAVLSLGLAYLSWRFVEKPFRRRGAGPLPNRARVFQAAAVATVALIGMGTIGQVERGMPYRFSSVALVDPNAAGTGAGPTGCVQDFGSVDSSPCLIGDASPIRIAVIGDSHATQWVPALVQLARTRRWQFELFSKVGCPAPAIDFALDTLRRNYHECSTWRSAVLSKIATRKYAAVVITSATFIYTKKNHMDLISPDRWRAGLSSLFDQFAQRKTPVLYIVDNPHFPFDPVQCTQLALKIGYDPAKECSVRSQPLWDPQARDQELAAARQAKGVDTLNLDKYFCGGGACSPYRGGTLMMRDDNHISNAAAERIAPDIAQALETVLATGAPNSPTLIHSRPSDARARPLRIEP